MLVADKVTQLLYFLTGGRVGEKQLSYSMLLLHTVGRKSGKLRTHTLLYFRDGEDLIICASNNGSHAPPAWYLNLQAQPRVRIQHGQVRQEVIAEIVGPGERERLWHALLQVRPQYADYQKRTAREFPLIRLKPLVGEESGLTQKGKGIVMNNYVFEQKVIHEICCSHLGEPLEQMFANITADLAAHYPGAIDDSKPWIFNNAGGVMIEMKLLYASAREYVMIWGTPIGSEGHTGRHLVEFHDTVLDGEAWYYQEGEFQRAVYTPGDYIFLGKGQSAGMHYPDHVWMVEYARGVLPSLLPFGLADALTSTHDFKTAWQTVAIYFSLLFRSLSKGQKVALGSLVAATLLLTLGRARGRGRRRK